MSYSSPARSLFAPAQTRAAQRIGLQLFLALFLLLAQTGLFLHELEHQSTEPDAYCALCLAAHHIGDAVHASQLPDLISPPALPPLQLAILAVHTAPGVPFSARAPPAVS